MCVVLLVSPMKHGLGTYFGWSVKTATIKEFEVFEYMDLTSDAKALQVYEEVAKQNACFGNFPYAPIPSYFRIFWYLP